MDSVVAKQDLVKISQTYDLKTVMESQCEADHADEEAEVNSWSAVDDEKEAQHEADQSEEPDSDSESSLTNDSGANYKECWKFIFLWKVLSLIGLLSSLMMAEESVDVASMFNLDVECCAGQDAGSTALCIKANACLPCESLISDTVSEELIGNFSSFASGMDTLRGQVAGVPFSYTTSKESIGNSSSFALGMDNCIGQVAGVPFSDTTYEESIGNSSIASLACNAELHNYPTWNNVSQGKAISLDSEFHINSVSHKNWQHTQEEVAKSCILQWCPLWPSVGVGSVLLAISVKVMF